MMDVVGDSAVWIELITYRCERTGELMHDFPEKTHANAKMLHLIRSAQGSSHNLRGMDSSAMDSINIT